MAADSPKGNGRRGRRKLLAVTGLILTMGLALLWGGCGSSAQVGSTGSQLDDQSAGATTISTSTVGGVGPSGQGSVMVDYQWDQCTAEMTQRYGDQETAKKVCSELQSSYPASQKSQLTTILPKVESTVGATPVPGATIPGSGGGNSGGTSGDGTGGGSPGGGSPGGGGDSGWGSNGIEITVPPAP